MSRPLLGTGFFILKIFFGGIMKLTGAQMVCESLIREGVDTMFGIPGGAILPLYQTFHEYPQLKHILVRHEQGAAMAADGYSRMSDRKKFGVFVMQDAAGAENSMGALSQAYADNIPVLVMPAGYPMSSIQTKPNFWYHQASELW